MFVGRDVRCVTPKESPLKSWFVWLAFFVISLLAPLSAWAGASLVIHPTVVIFDGASRSASVNLTNHGNTVGTFEIGWVDFTMTPEGGLKKLAEPSPWSVRPHVRYSPRRTTLQPGELQLIKIALRPRRDAPEGEYFSHFRVLTIDDGTPVVEEDPEALATKTSVAVKARTALAIPIIWRNSNDEPAASIDSVEVNEAGKRLLVTVRRSGAVSLRGYVHVVAISAEGGPTALASPVPVVIYPNLDTRSVSVPLSEGVVASGLVAGSMVLVASNAEIPDVRSALASHPLAN